MTKEKLAGGYQFTVKDYEVFSVEGKDKKK
jgi:hypothetical protein